MDEKTTSVAPEANRLYWDSSDSVAEISNGLGISRRALYDLIEPMPTGVECSSCGAELHYSNRSAKTAGVARCLVCGRESDLVEDAEHEEGGTIPPYSTGWPAASNPAATNGTHDRAVTIAGFALAGVVFGAIATLLIRRRR